LTPLKIFRDENGDLRPKCEGSFKDGLLHGNKNREYHLNGMLKRIANHQNGKLYGFIKNYESNGKLTLVGKVETEKDWKFDAFERPPKTHMSNCKCLVCSMTIEGFGIQSFPNGQFYYIGGFCDGKKHGSGTGMFKQGT
jgi:hypothetical protein